MKIAAVVRNSKLQRISYKPLSPELGAKILKKTTLPLSLENNIHDYFMTTCLKRDDVTVSKPLV
jgi:hypothetical protein